MPARSLIRGTRSALTRTDNLRVACEACVFGHAEHTCGRYVTNAADMSAAALESGATTEDRINTILDSGPWMELKRLHYPGSAIEVQDELLARAGKL
jgi:hypothetical protein